jgi:hypothetical protein
MSCLTPPRRALRAWPYAMIATPSLHSSVSNACCQSNRRSLSSSSLSRLIAGSRLALLGRDVTEGRLPAVIFAADAAAQPSPHGGGGTMRNDGGRCGQVRLLLGSRRCVVARIASCLLARCSEEATFDVRRDRPAPHRSSIGTGAQFAHLSRFASDPVLVRTRNPTWIRGVMTVDLPCPRDGPSDESHAYVKALVRFIRQHN